MDSLHPRELSRSLRTVCPKRYQGLHPRSFRFPEAYHLGNSSSPFFFRCFFLISHIGPETANAQDDADIGATDYSRRTSPADQRQRLSGHRYQVYRHRHIRQGLDDNQQSAAQHQEFRKELITSTSNHPTLTSKMIYRSRTKTPPTIPISSIIMA